MDWDYWSPLEHAWLQLEHPWEHWNTTQQGLPGDAHDRAGTYL
jgi:hypothetical protein